MARKPISPIEDIKLQGTIVDAIEVYFNKVYTPDSEFSSVGTGFVDDDGRAIAYLAFRVPGGQAKMVDELLRSVAEAFEARIIVSNPHLVERH